MILLGDFLAFADLPIYLGKLLPGQSSFLVDL